jgi:purine-binding chemotaxis protein CheW
MSSDLVAYDEDRQMVTEQTTEFSTFSVAGQLLGINVLDVQDVLNPMKIATVPLAGNEVAGLLNLRGRIVTAIDMRQKLGLDAFEDRSKCLSIVVEKDQELYSLIVDKVGDVINIPNSKFEHNPPNLKPAWADISSGVYRLEGKIMLVIDIDSLLSYASPSF